MPARKCRCRRSGAATAWPPKPWNSGRAAAAACTTGSAIAGRRTVGPSSACRRKGMQLYLIRHADAVSAEENPARPLSERGLRQVAQLVAHFLHSGTLRPGEIWHSPLTRSGETATVLAAGLNLAIPLVEQPGLEPEDDPRDTIERLAHATGDLAIVGHEPHLGALAALLIH